MSSDSWKLEKDLCRCCHAEGSFHSLSEPRIILGQEEKYAEMLRSSMNIHLSPAMGLLSEMTYTICEACILRVRDAFNFKRQVLLCEERFKDIYKNVVKSLDPVLNAELVKQEVPGGHQQNIKIEVSVEDDDDDFGMGWDDADDDKSVLQLQLEDSRKKGKAKAKPKPKPQPKPKAMKALPKKVVPVRKTKDLTQSASASTPQPDISTPKSKKGDQQLADYYTVTGSRYKCNRCERSFASQPLVSQHYRFVHLKRRPRERKCPQAGCEEKVPGYLRAYHMEEAHAIPAPSCGVCGKRFRYPCHVLQHQKKVHMGEKTVVCCVCDKAFFNNLSLRLHMSTHSKVKKFKCPFCQREFRWENNLKDHVKIHTGDRRYVCGICEKSFVQKSTLKQHSSRNHPGFYWL